MYCKFLLFKLMILCMNLVVKCSKVFEGKKFW